VSHLVLGFESDDFLQPAAALLDDLGVVVVAASRTRPLRRPDEQIDASIARAVRTARRQRDRSVARLLSVTAQRYDCRTTTPTRRSQPAQPPFHTTVFSCLVSLGRRIAEVSGETREDSRRGPRILQRRVSNPSERGTGGRAPKVEHFPGIFYFQI